MMMETCDPSVSKGRMANDLERAASVIKAAKKVTVVTHIDADGITSGAIASFTLKRLGIDHHVVFEKKITEATITMVNNSTDDVVWICDLGSAYLSEFKRSGIVITDHHMPDTKWRKKQTFIDDFHDIDHLNPQMYGASGSYEICGAGMTYLLSKTIDPCNKDLAFLAIIGAIGDLQDQRDSRLISYNRHILKDAEELGDVMIETDLRFFGRENRTLVQFLQYNNEPPIPGISDNNAGCQKLYSDLGIPLKKDGEPRKWSDLDPKEKKAVADRLLSMVADEEGAATRIYGEVYALPKFGPYNSLRDSKEFATILNSCGRYDDAETGLRLCMGDMSALEDADKNRADHRKNISCALSYIKENHLLRERRFVQYFDAGSEIRETVVGIVAGMLLNSGEVRSELPIFAFAEADDGIKVSARATRALTDRGLDLSMVMKTASEMIGGYGGGHKVAAGATIPKGKEEDFLDIVEDLVSSQVI
jgi:Single-stranded DNA-specific exonuclease